MQFTLSSVILQYLSLGCNYVDLENVISVAQAYATIIQWQTDVLLPYFMLLEYFSQAGLVINQEGQVVRVFTSGLGNWGSIPSQVIPKTQKIILDINLLNTQRYRVRIKGEVEQSSERSCALSYTSV